MVSLWVRLECQCQAATSPRGRDGWWGAATGIFRVVQHYHHVAAPVPLIALLTLEVSSQSGPRQRLPFWAWREVGLPQGS